VFIGIDDLDELHQEIMERPNLFMRPGVEAAEWREKFMTVIDPFGNRLVFVEKSSSSVNQKPA
jgi:hypothetical protein